MTGARAERAQELIRQGFDALGEGRPRDAADLCRRAIALDPASPGAHFLVGLVATDLDDRKTAIRAFGSVTKLQPENAAAFAQLARLFMRMGQPARAENALAAAIALKPADAPVVDLVGVVHSMLGDQKEAPRWYRRAVDLAPENEEYRINLATAEMFLGENDGATRTLAPLIARPAPPAQAEWLLSSIKRQSDVKRPAALLERAKISEPRAAAFLAYAAGKEFEDCGAWAKAFEAFDLGARAKRSSVNYDERADEDRFAAMTAVFDHAYAQMKRPGCDDPAPVFVVGQPRTGTTLIERIITSHSAVRSAGELQQFRLSLGRLAQAAEDRADAPAGAARAWARIEPEALGREYLRASAPMRPHSPRFVDKLPGNYFYVPLILAALPNAKIVHVTRDPMDACFASFKQLFADAYPHSYDQEEMARHYGRYHALMKHWRDLYPGAFLDISYEETVGDLDTNARRLIDFLELPWEDQCLRYYEQDSAVATASAVQVREKPHARSVGRWRRYENELAPMRRALAAAGVISMG